MRQYFALRKLPHAPPQLLLLIRKRKIHVASWPSLIAFDAVHGHFSSIRPIHTQPKFYL
jgi:hypothetical protein